MRLLSVILLVCVSGLAHAAFREAPPASVHLIETVARSASDGTVDLDVDPQAGTFAGQEVLSGAIAVFALDVVCVGISAGIITAMAPPGGRSSIDHPAGVGGILVSALVVGLVELVLSPIAAAMGVLLANPRVEVATFRRALRGAFTIQMATVAFGVASALAYPAILRALGSVDSPGAILVQIASIGILLGLHFVGVPMAASYTVHWADSDPRTRGAETSRRPRSLPITPAEFYEQASPSSASRVFTVAF